MLARLAKIALVTVAVVITGTNACFSGPITINDEGVRMAQYDVQESFFGESGRVKEEANDEYAYGDYYYDDYEQSTTNQRTTQPTTTTTTTTSTTTSTATRAVRTTTNWEGGWLEQIRISGEKAKEFVELEPEISGKKSASEEKSKLPNLDDYYEEINTIEEDDETSADGPMIPDWETALRTRTSTTTEKSTTSEPGPLPNCPKLKCDFNNGDLCGYKSFGEGPASPLPPRLQMEKDEFDRMVRSGDILDSHLKRSWMVNKGHFGNRVTGVVAPADGTPFAGAYLYPGESAFMTVFTETTEPFIFMYKGYENTERVSLHACCGTNCRLTRTVLTARRTWTRLQIECPANTDTVSFVCFNDGLNQGACGVDQVQVVDPRHCS